MKIGEVARRLGVTTDIVRYASSSYSDHMSTSAGGQVKGAKRQFTERDCQMIATILKLREQGLAPEQIGAALATADLEPCPAEPTAAETAARESIALVAQPQYERALDKVGELQQDLTTTKAERDRALQTWQVDTTRLNARIADLERLLGLTEGRLGERQPTRFWLAVLAAAVAVAVIATAALLLLAR